MPPRTASNSSALIEAHRLSDGAAFVAPGTPTNNLADSASGYSITDVPAPGPARDPAGSLGRIGPGRRTRPGSRRSRAARRRVEHGTGRSGRHEPGALRGHLGLVPAPAGPARVQPGLLPQVYAHVTTFVRGGGPLPAIRVGRQPYGVLPVHRQGDLGGCRRERVPVLARRLPTAGSETSGHPASSTAPAGPDCSPRSPSPHGCACARPIPARRSTFSSPPASPIRPATRSTAGAA